LLARLKPRLVFSKGGYVSVPPVAAARLLGIPTVTHESDVDPGLATRINARFSDHLLLSYEQSRRYFAADAVTAISVTGNPVRVDLAHADARKGRQAVGAVGEKPILLALGGSQGALELNELLQRNLDRLTRRFFVVHQMGSRNFRDSAVPGYRPVAFFQDEYPHVLAAADVVLCRAGAGTLWELAALEKPAVLLPLRHGGSRGDQIRNAEAFAEAGAAVVLEPGPSDEVFVNTVLELSANPERRAAMAVAAGRFPARDAARRVAELVLEAVGVPRGA
jgi:UDP-N-acetylglucosamine--N-acetylmuramyl-(pentapeptide) pyrophosphoryl-undecaprenol N-acetylglucosamine transferase